jgi:hypothetical protein
MAIATTVQKRTRQAKLAAKGAGMALTIAKQLKDPKYKRYITFKKKYMALKKELTTKYKGKARAKIGISY